MTSRIPLVLALLLLLPAGPAPADIFVLQSGGRVHGELLNPQKAPDEPYSIKTTGGAVILLETAAVTEVVEQRDVEVEYEKKLLELPDTMEGHAALAQWCAENHLSEQRNVHLARIIEFEPDNEPARRALDYVRDNGRWITRDNLMRERGYVKHNGRWRLPQAIELEKRRKEKETAERGWYAQLRQWESWLDGEKATAAIRNIQQISDPNATKALIHYLNDENDYDRKAYYATGLARVGTTEAIEELAKRAVDSPDEDFRYAVLDLLTQKKPARAIEVFVAALTSTENKEVNRAAIGLARMENKVAIRPLIDALVTKHKRKVGGQQGQISPTFGRDSRGNVSSGLGIGGGPKIIVEYLRNREVLETLIKLTGEDFDYDVQAWKRWYASQKQPPPVGGRRD